jgi:hypothetical protein
VNIGDKMRINKRFVFISSSITFIIPFAFYLLFLHGPISSNDQNWANFGSYIGGIVSPVFSFLSFIIVLIIYYQSNEDKKEDQISKKYFQYLELLERCLSHVECKTGESKKEGEEVFSAMNGIAFSMNQFSEKRFVQDRQFPYDNPEEGILLSYVFFRNSVKPFIDLLSIIIKYIERLDIAYQDEFLKILNSQLTEQEKMSFAINNHKRFSEFIKVKDYFYIDTPIDGLLAIGKKIDKLYELNK